MKVLVYSDYGSGCPDAIKEFNVKVPLKTVMVKLGLLKSKY